jgi:Na+/H+-dicarboxylate symporter
MSRVGRMAWKSILYFVSLTFIALMIGLIIVNIIKPGEGVSLAGATFTSNDTGHISLKDELNKIFQPSFFQAAVVQSRHWKTWRQWRRDTGHCFYVRYILDRHNEDQD